MAGDSTTSPRGRFALASIGALAASLTLLVTLLGSGEAAAAPSGGIKADSNCGAQPAGLSPDGSAPTRFTMLIRINQQVNVNDWVNFDSATGGLGGRVRPQDIFVINTRHENSDPALAASLATNLRTAFPCNRIIALNGLGFNPTVAGYAFTLLDHPSIYALMSDFEPDGLGRLQTTPGRPPWSYNFKVAFPRIKQWDGRLAGTLVGERRGRRQAQRPGSHRPFELELRPDRPGPGQEEPPARRQAPGPAQRPDPGLLRRRRRQRLPRSRPRPCSTSTSTS